MITGQDNRRQAVQAAIAFVLGCAAWIVMPHDRGKSIDYASGRMAISCLLLAFGAIAGSFADRSNYLAGPCWTSAGYLACAFGWAAFVPERGGPLFSFWLIYVLASPIVIAFPAAALGTLAHQFWRAVWDVQGGAPGATGGRFEPPA